METYNSAKPVRIYVPVHPLEGRFEPVASGPKVSIALSDRPVALLVVCVWWDRTLWFHNK